MSSKRSIGSISSPNSPRPKTPKPANPIAKAPKPKDANLSTGKHLTTDKHIQWKDPPVDKIYHYTPLQEPRVHWRNPVISNYWVYPPRSSQSKIKVPSAEKKAGPGISGDTFLI
jgi:hypothetical protein